MVTCYTLLAVFASLYFKWWSMIDLRALPYTLPLVLLTYAFVTFVSNLQVRSLWMIVFPLYALTQTLVMPLLGAGYYFVLLRRCGTPGRYASATSAGRPPRRRLGWRGYRSLVRHRHKTRCERAGRPARPHVVHLIGFATSRWT